MQISIILYFTVPLTENKERINKWKKMTKFTYCKFAEVHLQRTRDNRLRNDPRRCGSHMPCSDLH